jgi:hypothetical protein
MTKRMIRPMATEIAALPKLAGCIVPPDQGTSLKSAGTNLLLHRTVQRIQCALSRNCITPFEGAASMSKSIQQAE